MNDDRSPLRRATLQDTGDCFYIGKARDLNRALYGMAERAVGRAPSQDIFETEHGYTPGLSKEVAHMTPRTILDEMTDALKACEEYLGLTHLTNDVLEAGIKAGLDDADGLCKGKGHLTLTIRTALAKAKARTSDSGRNVFDSEILAERE